LSASADFYHRRHKAITTHLSNWLGLAYKVILVGIQLFVEHSPNTVVAMRE